MGEELGRLDLSTGESESDGLQFVLEAEDAIPERETSGSLTTMHQEIAALQQLVTDILQGTNSLDQQVNTMRDELQTSLVRIDKAARNAEKDIREAQRLKDDIEAATARLDVFLDSLPYTGVASPRLRSVVQVSKKLKAISHMDLVSMKATEPWVCLTFEVTAADGTLTPSYDHIPLRMLGYARIGDTFDYIIRDSPFLEERIPQPDYEDEDDDYDPDYE